MSEFMFPLVCIVTLILSSFLLVSSYELVKTKKEMDALERDIRHLKKENILSELRGEFNETNQNKIPR